MKDILIGGNKIMMMAPQIPSNLFHNTQLIEPNQLWVNPSFIDGQIHIAGAGGQRGPGRRTPEGKIKDLIEGGVTTVIGCLGTDRFARSPVEVLMKVKSIRAWGFQHGCLQVLTNSLPPPSRATWPKTSFISMK